MEQSESNRKLVGKRIPVMVYCEPVEYERLLKAKDVFCKKKNVYVSISGFIMNKAMDGANEVLKNE